jgi:pyruvate/2-oxoglutarate dehydrogenase complex dihydrolipoamide dehydrogenase (E3) component
VTVMVRSIILRGFDQQMANIVAEEMEQRGVHFIYQAKPKLIKRQADGLLVHWENKVMLKN